MTKAKTKTGVRVSLAMFDWDPVSHQMRFELRRSAAPIGRFTPLGLGDYNPNGGTPLRDAAMAMIDHLAGVHERNPGDVTIGLLADESGSMQRNRAAVVQGLNEFVAGMAGVDDVDPEAGGKVLCVIVTDGLENSSVEASPDDLREATAQREGEGWTFIYLGANQDAWHEGTRTVGLSGGVRGQTVSYDSTPTGTVAAMASVTQDTTSYLSDNKGYARQRESSSNRRVSESGEETVVTPPEPPATESYGDVEAALKRAREGS